MKWAKGVFISATLLGITATSAIQDFCYAAPTAGDVVIEVEPVLQERSSAPLQATKTSPSNAQFSFPTFNSQQLDRQLRLYLDYVEKYGTPDILIVGSSRALQGVDPLMLQKGLAQQGYPNLRVFNFGINGATAQVVNWLLQRLLSPEQLPKLIIWADGARAFNSGRVDQTFHKILQSDGQRLLASGVRPSVISNRLKVGQICLDFMPLALQAHRSDAPLYYPVQPLIQPRNTPSSPQERCQQPLKITVRNTEPLPSSTDSSNTLSESLGFQLVSSRFSPTTYFRRYPKVSGAYDADYRNFTLNGTQSASFENLVRYVSVHKISLVFVNLPLTDTYLDFDRSFYEEQFQARMQKVARSKQIIFRDLGSSRQLRSDSYFADPSHLNQHGAAAVSTRLSQELTDLLPNVFGPRRSDKTQIQSSRIPSWCKNTCFLLPRIPVG